MSSCWHRASGIAEIVFVGVTRRHGGVTLPGSLATGQRLPHVNPPRDAGNYVLRIAASLLLARFAIMCLELAAVLCCVASFIELLCCAFELIVVMHF